MRHNKLYSWDWRDSSAAKSIEALVEGLGLASNSVWYFMTSCNSDSRGPDSLFLSPQVLECMECTYIHGYKILIYIG